MLGKVLVILGCLIWLAGCQTEPKAVPVRSGDAIFVLHGVDGQGPWYDPLIDALREGVVRAMWRWSNGVGRC